MKQPEDRSRRRLSEGELECWVWQWRSAQRRSARHLQIRKSKTTEKENTMTQTGATQRGSEQHGFDSSVSCEFSGSRTYRFAQAQ